MRRRHPHLKDAQLELVGAALREYFRLCGKAGRRMLAMPSQKVDSARREFIVIMRNEQHLCRRGLGRFPQHTPADAGPRANSGAIACDSSRTRLLFVSICTGEPE